MAKELQCVGEVWLGLLVGGAEKTVIAMIDEQLWPSEGLVHVGNDFVVNCGRVRGECPDLVAQLGRKPQQK
jgi:hypothetical protein